MLFRESFEDLFCFSGIASAIQAVSIGFCRFILVYIPSTPDKLTKGTCNQVHFRLICRGLLYKLAKMRLIARGHFLIEKKFAEKIYCQRFILATFLE